MRTYAAQIWDPEIDRLTEGDVIRSDGSCVNLVSLIQMRWGWPRMAACTAAAHLRVTGGPSICVDQFGNGKPNGNKKRALRLGQQMQLVQEVPVLLGELFAGLIGRAKMDEDHADRDLSLMVIRFDASVTELGMVRDIVNAAAVRLGIPSDAVAERIEVDRSTSGVVSVLVKNTGGG